MIKPEGKKIVDISSLVEIFDREGTIESWSGKIGNGKTYGAVRRAIRDLQEGRVVYTNFRLDLTHIVADQRKSFVHAFWNFVFARPVFYDIDIQKNWHYYDLDSSDIVDFLANLTDCVVYADEGQDIFDSYEGTKMSKSKRKSLTRTRHLNKTLVIISQRPQAIAVTARANVNIFNRSVKLFQFKKWVYFKIYSTEEVDASNMPIWEGAEYRSDGYWGENKYFNAYNTHELRAGIPRSQQNFFTAYYYGFKDRTLLLLSFFPTLNFQRLKALQVRLREKSLGVKDRRTTIKNSTDFTEKRKVTIELPSSRVGSIQRTVGVSSQSIQRIVPMSYTSEESLKLPF